MYIYFRDYLFEVNEVKFVKNDYTLFFLIFFRSGILIIFDFYSKTQK